MVTRSRTWQQGVNFLVSIKREKDGIGKFRGKISKFGSNQFWERKIDIHGELRFGSLDANKDTIIQM